MKSARKGNPSLAMMDEEHERLMARVEELRSAVARRMDRETIERCVDRMVHEASAHFGHENRELLGSSYPLAVRHVDAHARLEEKLWEALRRPHAGDPHLGWEKKGLVIEQLLLEHQRTEDLQYRDYLASRNAAGSGSARS
jgi:hemerythrin-like metal-binding protein